MGETIEHTDKNKFYVIFDGTCGFCNTSAIYIAKRDLNNQFILVSNASDFGKALLHNYGIEKIAPHSIIYLEHGEVNIKSKAIQKILEKLPGHRPLKILLRITPRFVQDFFYDVIANIRRLLPKKANCTIPEPHLRDKFRI